VLDDAAVLERIDRETVVAPGIRVVPAPGHTPGHLAVSVADGVDELLWAADAFVHPANVADPEPASRMDTDRPLTVATRRSLLERAAQRGAVLAATHHRVRGRVLRDGDRYHLSP
jgi:glyoxylase-like metal-dependent hydrolase (beta-lactamase superfamily II)